MAAESRRNLIEALHAKYGCDDSGFDHIFVSKRAPGKSEEGKLVLPRTLSMDSENISAIGDEEELRKVCGRVCELDLSHNHISDWDQVCSIVTSLPHLTFLNISHNPLPSTASPLPSGTCSENKLRGLVLNATNVSWECVVGLLKIFTGLEELHLSINDLSTFDTSDLDPYESLTQLYLNRNNIRDWNEVVKLGQIFPNLTQLVIIQNPIEDHRCSSQDGADDVCSKVFAKLTMINVSTTLLSGWDVIEKFRSFPSLSDIRITGLPFLEAYEEKQRWELLVSYLPNIKRLNGSPVDSEDRAKAERNFIRFYMDAKVKPDRYHELKTQHGEVEQLADVDLTPPDNVSVTLHFENKKILLFIDTKKTVGELKKEICKSIGHPFSKVRLFHTDTEGWVGSTELLLMKRAIHSIPIRNGNELHADLRP